MKLHMQTKFVRGSGPVETTVGSEVVLMVLASGRCYGLGETGSEVWRLLASPTSVPAVVATLAETYVAPADVLTQDVIELVETPINQGLVTTVS